MHVSRRSQVPPFEVMEVVAAANARRALGHDVISLCAGEPSGGAAGVVRARARVLLAGGSLAYTEATGRPDLRAELAAHYRRWYGVAVDPRRIAVTTGASGAFVLVFLAAFDAGDRVVVVRPGYPAYRNTLAALGCDVVDLVCGPETDHRPSVAQLEELVARSGPVDGLVVAGPANPTGTLVDAATLDALAVWCAEHGVRLVSDEIYHGLTYDPETGAAVRGPGAPTAAAHVAGPAGAGAVVVSSFSKYWAMTGWRLGWAVLPDDLVRPVDTLAGNLALCPPTLAQHAAVAAFTPEASAAADEAADGYAAARAVVLARLDELGWTRAAPADGAFYVYADVSASGLASPEYCARLLAEADVALTPGTDFDPVDGRDWVRLSFATTPEVVGRAVDRIAGWRGSLRR